MARERELVQTDEYISTTLNNEEVILHTESEKYFGLNELGTQLWRSLEEPRTVDELLTTVHEEFDISEEQSRKDVETFIEELESAGLIESSDDSRS